MGKNFRQNGEELLPLKRKILVYLKIETPEGYIELLFHDFQ
jgi:hypothetical protein